MKKLFALMVFALLSLPALALADTRALLIACSDFVSQPDLGSAISGNLHMIGSALISSEVRLSNLSIEDGTIGTSAALEAALTDAFGDAEEDDLSILYLCTHGVLSSSDDGQVYLLLGDGQSETPLGAQQLYELIRPIQGEKLLIVDACYSGALISRGVPRGIHLPGSREAEPAFLSPMLSDPSIHVLTSASGDESSWYYNGEGLRTGAVSYFASALSTGLGLYGSPEADQDGDGSVTLAELHGYLRVAVPSSSSQLLSMRADGLTLPVARSAALSRPLTGFSYGTSLLRADDPLLDFSFTVTHEDTHVQYRLVEYVQGAWDWANALTFLDGGDDGESGLLSAGRKQRTLDLGGVVEGGYLMMQVFSVSGEELVLCSERLIGVQPQDESAEIAISCRKTLHDPGAQELPIDVSLSVPAELTVSVFDAQGALVRRLAASQLTRPAKDGAQHLYWDGRDDSGQRAANGAYTIAAEARIGAKRVKATAQVVLGS